MYLAAAMHRSSASLFFDLKEENTIQITASATAAKPTAELQLSFLSLPRDWIGKGEISGVADGGQGSSSDRDVW